MAAFQVITEADSPGGIPGYFNADLPPYRVSAGCLHGNRRSATSIRNPFRSNSRDITKMLIGPAIELVPIKVEGEWFNVTHI